MDLEKHNMKKHPIELQEHDWQSLDEQVTLRVPCSHWKCQSKKAAFTITRTLDGCVYNCYRCGTTGAIFMGSSPQSAQRKLSQLRNSKDFKTKQHMYISLPTDFIPMHMHDKSIPPQAYAWLYQYELNDDDMYKRYIGWTYRLQRVVFPIYYTYSNSSFTSLMAWQGRDVFYDRNTKLYNKGVLKNPPLRYYTEIETKLIFPNNRSIKDRSLKYNNNQYNNIYYWLKANYKKKANYLIIVEDIISAIKCHNQYGHCDVIALLRSNLSTDFTKMFSGFNKIFIWLDWDARVKSIKTSRKLQSIGFNTSTIRTKEDPKAVPYKKMPVIL